MKCDAAIRRLLFRVSSDPMRNKAPAKGLLADTASRGGLHATHDDHWRDRLGTHEPIRRVRTRGRRSGRTSRRGHHLRAGTARAYSSIRDARACCTGAVRERIAVGTRLPADVELRTVASDWGPSVTRYRYVYSNDRVYFVEPSTREVVYEID
jgi:hypothetical protein